MLCTQACARPSLHLPSAYILLHSSSSSSSSTLPPSLSRSGAPIAVEIKYDGVRVQVHKLPPPPPPSVPFAVERAATPPMPNSSHHPLGGDDTSAAAPLARSSSFTRVAPTDVSGRVPTDVSDPVPTDAAISADVTALPDAGFLFFSRSLKRVKDDQVEGIRAALPAAFPNAVSMILDGEVSYRRAATAAD